MSNWNMPPGVSTNDIPGQEDAKPRLRRVPCLFHKATNETLLWWWECADEVAVAAWFTPGEAYDQWLVEREIRLSELNASPVTIARLDA